MPSRFYREKNRTLSDIFRGNIMSRAQATLGDVAQKIVQYSRTHHRWVNRTGALEESISWVPPKRTPEGWQTEVYAGGWSVARYAFNYGRRKQRKQNRRNYRYQRGVRFAVGLGQGLYVDYAPYVERKGFPVLTQGIDRYRNLIGRVLKQELTSMRLGL